MEEHTILNILYFSAMKAGVGTGIESCRNVEVGNTTEFTLELTLDDCALFGLERCVREGERE